jgi:hypothetical protein
MNEIIQEMWDNEVTLAIWSVIRQLEREQVKSKSWPLRQISSDFPQADAHGPVAFFSFEILSESFTRGDDSEGYCYGMVEDENGKIPFRVTLIDKDGKLHDGRGITPYVVLLREGWERFLRHYFGRWDWDNKTLVPRSHQSSVENSISFSYLDFDVETTDVGYQRIFSKATNQNLVYSIAG